MSYSIDQIRERVDGAVSRYNESVDDGNRIVRVKLFGSYADGRQTDSSDIDLLVTFSTPVVSFFTLARALEAMERGLEKPVDLVQDPVPSDSLLEITREVPLYEAA